MLPLLWSTGTLDGILIFLVGGLRDFRHNAWDETVGQPVGSVLLEPGAHSSNYLLKKLWGHPHKTLEALQVTEFPESLHHSVVSTLVTLLEKKAHSVFSLLLLLLNQFNLTFSKEQKEDRLTGVNVNM